MAPTIDTAILRELIEARAAWPVLTITAAWITIAGSAVATIGITMSAAVWLAVARRWRRMLLLLAIVASGRLMIDGLKLLVARPRPPMGIDGITVNSWSFPSGHAGNSMIVFLTLALLVAPARWRLAAIVAAICASLVIGATRPLLGVHWPSDVLAGWLLGLIWVTGLTALARRRGWLNVG